MLKRVTGGKAVDIRTQASKTWVLCPAEEAHTPPAIHLPGEIDRIQSVSPWRMHDAELASIHGGQVRHASSEAHLLEDVELAGAFLYKDAAVSQPGFGKRHWWLSGSIPLERYTESHLITSHMGSHFFGTLLLDDYPLALLPPEGAHRLPMCTQPSRHNAQYRELLELPMSLPVQRARIDRLIVYTDFAQNSLKVKRYEVLRTALRRNCPRTATSSAGVYLRRGRSGELRLLDNEAQVEEMLAGMGFDIIDPMVLTAAEISSRTLDAPLVISVEGSHLSHAIFSASDTATFVVLQPPDRLCMTYKEYTDQMGSMRFAFLVGDRSAQGFRVEPDHLKRLLDLVATVAR
ncbi:MAG: glycosyltransferase family 61 protein [Hydrogenophaga sp.]|uniref:glycosyltransferase 61 family protein n=1 Tax=Hydrogenophaga sp. TaxID=1904254 RepID=UPI0026102B36|nr:glycosyltransferase family 61 protein [Hydrogenophaga sp.]MCV0437574.1 glycosyltransferase family 61 protein [Hydrogenophaga sp.]